MISDMEIVSSASDDNEQESTGFTDLFTLKIPGRRCIDDGPLDAVAPTPLPIDRGARNSGLDIVCSNLVGAFDETVIELETPIKVTEPNSANDSDDGFGERGKSSWVPSLNSLFVKSQASHATGHDHPEEKQKCFWDKGSIEYWTKFYSDFNFSTKLERGLQRRGLTVGIGAGGQCGELLIWGVSGANTCK